MDPLSLSLAFAAMVQLYAVSRAEGAKRDGDDLQDFRGYLLACNQKELVERLDESAEWQEKIESMLAQGHSEIIAKLDDLSHMVGNIASHSGILSQNDAVSEEDQQMFWILGVLFANDFEWVECRGAMANNALLFKSLRKYAQEDPAEPNLVQSDLRRLVRLGYLEEKPVRNSTRYLRTRAGDRLIKPPVDHSRKHNATSD